MGSLASVRQALTDFFFLRESVPMPGLNSNLIPCLVAKFFLIVLFKLTRMN